MPSTDRPAPRLYIALIAVSLLAAFAYKLRVNGVFACPSAGYVQDAYLADCRALSYGDFDHGAFWYGLDSSSRSAAAGADVLFLGNSRMQFAFSGKPLRDWSMASSLRPYLLGFSFTENVKFTGPLLADLKPRARAYVINVDRFFDDRLTYMTEAIVRDAETQDRYREKHRWQVPHKHLCTIAPWACGDEPAVFRARTTGTWTIHGDGGFKKAGTGDGVPENTERWPEYIRIARDFIAGLPVARECVFLTMVPSSQSRTAEALAITEALGMPLISPKVEGLQTFDGSHLDKESADRWSAAFLQAVGPQIARCAARQGS